MPGIGRWTVLFIPLLLLSLLAWWYWPYPREAVYSFYRERGKSQTLDALSGYYSQESEHFRILYTDSDAENVTLILETAESVFYPVIEEVGYTPRGKVPLIVYPDREELRQAFGWGNNESAMGVYWSGTIRLLSPNVWIEAETERERRSIFKKMNPIAHELTHYVLDYMTNGNYPRWFTEGLAQRVEYKVTGFLWIEPKSTLRQDLYTLDDLQGRFDDLSNQPLAYRESYLLVDYMASTYGEERLTDLIGHLSRGVSFQQAVERSMSVSVDQCYEDWRRWISNHLQELDPR